MDFSTAVKTCLSKYATFSGRAARSEYWWFFLFVVVGSLILQVLELILLGGFVGPDGDIGIFSSIFSLAVLLPTIAVGVRRLHDRDMSGWWYLLVLIPLIGGLILLFFFVQKGTEGPNRFGPDPTVSS